MTEGNGNMDTRNPFMMRKVTPPVDHNNMLSYGVHPDGHINLEESPNTVSEYQLK